MFRCFPELLLMKKLLTVTTIYESLSLMFVLGKGACTPGSIAALHKTILAGNPAVHRPITPISATSIAEEEEEHHTSSPTPSAETPVPPIKKGRKPKTLAAFYERWGNVSSVPSEI